MQHSSDPSRNQDSGIEPVRHVKWSPSNLTIAVALGIAGLFLTVLLWGFSTVNTRIGDLAASMDSRFDDVNSRFDDVNARFDDINARFDDVNARFDSIDRRLQNLEMGFLDLSVRTARLEGHLGVPQAGIAHESESDSIAQQ